MIVLSIAASRCVECDVGFFIDSEGDCVVKTSSSNCQTSGGYPYTIFSISAGGFTHEVETRSDFCVRCPLDC
jgi:hypothetical protein